MLVLLEDVMVPIIALFDGFRIVKMEGVDKLLPFIVNQVSLQSLLCSLFCGLRSLRVWILLYSFVYIFRVLKAGGTVVLVIISQSAKVVGSEVSVYAILLSVIFMGVQLSVILYSRYPAYYLPPHQLPCLLGRQEGELDPDS
ncbi:uncharacterized protein LOC132609375 isoform X1 [Lycium barbarum]|uniref:uncharacterized protein LOC132609375 isoform X1 n=1 Tax=Lycium barbarum TaxID=112863 RepID=UPI00293EAD25|nr:uncharacterized protein LOC132609375 isoform X1 [Lycium barbarum]